MSKKKALGIAWIGNGFRPVYSIRQIKRGRQKGKLEVTYRHGSRIKKTKIDKLHKELEIDWVYENIPKIKRLRDLKNPLSLCYYW